RGEDRRGAAELDVDEAGAAGVVGVAFEEARRVTADRLDVVPVDLETQRGGTRPDQRPHPAVADRQAILTAFDGRIILEVGPRNECAQLHGGSRSAMAEQAGAEGQNGDPRDWHGAAEGEPIRAEERLV